ncbi:MAG: MBL fold metallo-hydrolase [Pseudomonadales bacterium]|nr:MBL fold metallo-hydrolase [Pseudomonadales bacterium]
MALEYPYPTHPESGTTVEVVEGVRWLTMPMGGSLTHINLYLLEDTDGWFVVDTGLADGRTKRLWHGIFDNELGGRPVKGVICTHMHPDHTGQAGMIVNHFRCPLYMTRAEYYQARTMMSWGFSSPQGSWLGEQFYHRYGMPTEPMKAMREGWKSRARGMAKGAAPTPPDPLPMAYQRLQDGDLLTIGDHDWQVVVGSGHSPEHACLHCHSLGVMISGDQILPVITSNVSVHPTEPEANPLKEWMESHDKLLDTPENTFVLPAHNLPFYGVRERLRDLISHHEDRMLAIEETCVEPRTAKDLLPVLFKRRLDARQIMMALGEAIAHCHLLMHRNRLKRDLGEDGRYRFLSIDPDLERRAHPGNHDAPDDLPIMV